MLLLGVSVLTSATEQTLREIGIADKVDDHYIPVSITGEEYDSRRTFPVWGTRNCWRIYGLGRGQTVQAVSSHEALWRFRNRQAIVDRPQGYSSYPQNQWKTDFKVARCPSRKSH